MRLVMKQVVIFLKKGVRLVISDKHPIQFFADSVLDVTVNLSRNGGFFYEYLTWLGSVNNLNNLVTLNSLIRYSQNPNLQTVAFWEKFTGELYIVDSKDIERVALV